MATDAQIIAAARAVADAVAAVHVAKEAVRVAAAALEVAQRAEREACDRVDKAEHALKLMARQKPAEPVKPPVDYAVLSAAIPGIYPTTGMTNVIPPPQETPVALEPVSATPAPSHRRRERV